MAFDYRILRTIRERQPRKITQQDVAEGTDIGRGNYSKKENGDVVVTTDDLDKLAAFYGISVVEFFLTDDEIQKLCESKCRGERSDWKGEMEAKLNEAFSQVLKLLRQIEQKDLELAELKRKLGLL